MSNLNLSSPFNNSGQMVNFLSDPTSSSDSFDNEISETESVLLNRIKKLELHERNAIERNIRMEISEISALNQRLHLLGHDSQFIRSKIKNAITDILNSYEHLSDHNASYELEKQREKVHAIAITNHLQSANFSPSAFIRQRELRLQKSADDEIDLFLQHIPQRQASVIPIGNNIIPNPNTSLSACLEEKLNHLGDIMRDAQMAPCNYIFQNTSLLISNPSMPSMPSMQVFQQTVNENPFFGLKRNDVFSAEELPNRKVDARENDPPCMPDFNSIRLEEALKERNSHSMNPPSFLKTYIKRQIEEKFGKKTSEIVELLDNCFKKVKYAKKFVLIEVPKEEEENPWRYRTIKFGVQYEMAKQLGHLLKKPTLPILVGMELSGHISAHADTLLPILQKMETNEELNAWWQSEYDLMSDGPSYRESIQAAQGFIGLAKIPFACLKTIEKELVDACIAVADYLHLTDENIKKIAHTTLEYVSEYHRIALEEKMEKGI